MTVLMPGDMITERGRVVSLIKPNPRTIDIKDIAGHLAKLCRWNGATYVPYSVAQHCVEVTDALTLTGDASPLLLMHGLLHDAHEAYMGDISSPVKRAVAHTAQGSSLGMLAVGIDQAIYKTFGLSWPPDADDTDRVHHADLAVLAAEARDLTRIDDPAALTDVAPVPWCIKPAKWQDAEARFLRRYHDLATRIDMEV